ncbi:VOC family protein [Paenibacillus sp. GCM10012306]|uniref:VOC family protein n=1 Tax=Paenibacillus sp. GCM10012306 TaxID=3317342 RepID=UPI003618EDBD
MKVTGFNHLTLKVKDLVHSLNFYTSILGLALIHRGKNDAYLEWGSAWICLIEVRAAAAEKVEADEGATEGNEQTVSSNIFREENGVDHVSFSITEEDFAEAVQILKSHKVPIVRGPVQRGRGWSVNFLDPDGIQLELHTSNLQERMTVWK